jgi:hypothetical protein
MNMKECYLDTINWLSQHPQNRIIVRVKTEKELKTYQKHFKEHIYNDLFLSDDIYDIIEWRVDSTLDK